MNRSVRVLDCVYSEKSLSYNFSETDRNFVQRRARTDCMTMDFILLDGLGGKGFLQRGNRTGTAFDEEVWAGLKDRQQG